MAQFSAATSCSTIMRGAATVGSSHQPFQAQHWQIPGLFGKDTFSCGSLAHAVMSSPNHRKIPRLCVICDGKLPKVLSFPQCTADIHLPSTPSFPGKSAYILHLYKTPLTFVSNSQDAKTKYLVPEALGALSTVDLNSRFLHPVLKATNFLLKEIFQLLPSFPGFLNLRNRSMLLKGVRLHLITAPLCLGWR